MDRDHEERLRALEEACLKAGANVTHQRREVLRTVVRADVHPDANAVFEAVQEGVPTISFDTLYRTLASLEAHDLIPRVHVNEERARLDGNHRPHHHFVCTGCGRILGFESRELKALRLPDDAAALGTPILTQLQVLGVCVSCKAPKGVLHEQET